MRNIKTCSILFVLYLSIFFNVDRFGVLPRFELEISSFVFVLGVSIVLLQISIGRFFKIPVLFSLLLTSAAYILCKHLFGGLVDFSQGDQVTVIILEFVLVLGIALMASLYSAAISDFEDIMLEFAANSSHKNLGTVVQARDKIQIEIDRCRRYNHSLAIIIIKADVTRYEQTHNSELLKINKYITKDYLLNKFGTFMDENVRSHDLVYKLNKKGALLLVCPETTKKKADLLLQKLRKKAEEQFGTVLKCGIATFPDEFVTFDELLVKAELSIEQPYEPFQIYAKYKN